MRSFRLGCYSASSFSKKTLLAMLAGGIAA
jgi:hypothetical protein